MRTARVVLSQFLMFMAFHIVPRGKEGAALARAMIAYGNEVYPDSEPELSGVYRAMLKRKWM